MRRPGLVLVCLLAPAGALAADFPDSPDPATLAIPPDTDVRGSGLRITALPRASAGATDRMDRIAGKLNGEMTPTTPIGTCRATDSRGLLDRSSSP